PATLPEALSLLSEHGDEAKILAGGQSLIPVMNFRLAQPSVVIDVNRVPGLDGLEATADGGLRIGALVRQSRLEREPLVAERSPLLAAAVPWIAHPQIRNRGTIGGSISHSDPKAELPAVMTALGARYRLLRRGDGDTEERWEERWVAAGDFCHGLFHTCLEDDELLAEIEIPPWPAGSGAAFSEVARRHGDYAMVGLAATVRLDGDGRYADARLAFLSVGDRPRLAQAAERLLGEAPSKQLWAAAAEAAQAEVKPAGDVHATADYRRHLAGVLVRRVLGEATARAREVAA
ncbi:MAG TPA: xanthine dehydrogenase family protein subunit M, partial [Thermoanaerobaculia bacterium]|nr:xanthine dehydrogenase family protein subunit M [Thermoanaerobaculia bacterium]